MRKDFFMNTKLITFIISIIAGLSLIVVGGYLAIDNYLHPQGLLFEAIVLGALGVLLTLMVTIAMSIGETILIFGKIMEQQVQMQKEMREISNMSTVKSGNINSILSNLLPGMTDENTSISITDLNTGEKADPDSFPIDLEAVRKMMSKETTENNSTQNNKIENMNLKQLEEELSKAIKKDNYERAGEINKAIKKLKGDENQDDPEEKSE